MISRRNCGTALVATAIIFSLFSLSFVATPVKFLAENVPVAHLLSVGRVTFRASLVFESVLLFILFLVSHGKSRRMALSAAIILAIQWVALMPELDDRTVARMSGTVLGPSSLHYWWIALDVARIAVYVFIVRLAFQNTSLSRAGPA